MRTTVSINNMKIGWRLGGGFGLVLLLSLILSILDISNHRMLAELTAKLYRHPFTVATSAIHIEAELLKIENSVKDVMLATSAVEVDQAVANIDMCEEAVYRDFEVLLERFLGDQEEVKHTLDLVKEWKPIRDEVIAHMRADERDQAKAVMAGKQAKHVEAIKQGITDVIDYARAKAEWFRQGAEETGKQALRNTYLVLALASIASVALAVFITRSVSSPIRASVAFLTRISQGNLTQGVPEALRDRKDEAGDLARTMQSMTESLRTQIRAISESTNVLGSSTNEISASATQVAAGAQETATAVAQTTATVEEVKQGAHLTSQKSKAVAEGAKEGLQMAHSGLKASGTVAEGMTRINEQMDSIADTIAKLGEQCEAIGEITSTVDDIAEQSNLLAVNAAVEAAKAGEHGKGFTVVAQEIRNLAEQSKQATKQVQGILKDIQKATAAAVMATELGSKAVAMATKESTSANESIQALSGSFTEAAQSAGQIAASTQEQLIGMDQVALAMESIKGTSQQNVASMKQLESAALALKDIGQNLTGLVARYKV